MPWEDFLASRMPAGSRLPKNFKTFDFYDEFTRIATSAKTLNTQTASKLADPKKIYHSLKKNIDTAARFEKHALLETNLTSAEISFRELQVAIPQGTTLSQWKQIRKAIDYGKAQGVSVKIIEVR